MQIISGAVSVCKAVYIVILVLRLVPAACLAG